ncbi:hypothetical protein BG004_002207, partial [Podila humilis]
MTLKIPIPGATIGPAQDGSNKTPSISDGVLTSGDNIHLLANMAAGVPAATESKGASSGSPSHSNASAANQDGDTSHEVAADVGPSTVPLDSNQPLVRMVPAGLNLPTDRPRSHVGPHAGALFSVPLSDSTISQLLSLAQDVHSDLSIAVLVAWTIVLSRLSSQENISLGVSGSVKAGNKAHLSTLAVDFTSEPDTSELFARVKRSLESCRDDPIAFYQASFYDHADGLSRSLVDGASANSFLELHFVHGGDNVDLNIRYAIDLYNKETIERYAGYINTVLVNMVADRTQPVAIFDILSSAEKTLLLEKWNDTGAEYPLDRCIHHLFEDQVEKAPDAIAIIHNNKKLTYLELNSLANCLAREISKAGVAPGDRVALFFERSIELVVAELAVLKAGAAYVPIDITAPEERQTFIMLDTGSKILVTKNGIGVPDQIQVPVLHFSADQKNMEYEPNANITTYQAQGSSLGTAYVKYTSGTTGVPKGVVSSHCSITSTIINNGCVEVGKEDCVAMALNPAFVLSSFDLWLALLNGARVVIIDEDTKLNPTALAAALIRYQVTYMFITAPLLVQYAHDIGETLSNLRYLISGGEQVQIKAFSAIQQHGGPVRLINRYGSTEMTSGAVYTAIRAVNQLDRLPIGRPSSNRRAYVLDQYRNPVPIGALGDLYIGGPGLATGYLNHPDLTADKFLSDPFSDIKGA